MIDPHTLVDNTVTKLQAIGALVSEVGGAEFIRGYKQAYPTALNLARAIQEIKENEILVAWRRTTVGGAGQERYRHELSILYQRYSVFPLIANGTPDGTTLKLIYTDINTACRPIGGLTCEPQTLFVTEQTSIDIFESRIVLVERGDG